MIKPGKAVRVPDIVLRKAQGGPKITMLTVYDASMARKLAESGAIDILLVGDSLGMVQLGYNTTVPVTMGDMVRHTRAVRAGAPDALIVADMPFLSHQVSEAQALRNAGRLVQQGGATAVKIEGGSAVVRTIARIVEAGIPVMGHLGLQPQSIHALGGFRRQAKTASEQEQLVSDGLALQEVGVFSIVLEFVPDAAARALRDALTIPVIGIGSGPDCDGQVLVTHDVLGLTGTFVPAFAKRFADAGGAVDRAARWFAEEVRSGEFPPRTGTWTMPQVQSVNAAREQVARARARGARVGFVPTMGALHAGHAELLAQARRDNDYVVTSIFVNPLQFDRSADLAAYPQTLEADLKLCVEARVNLIFHPQVRDLYPSPQITFAETPTLGQNLCGAQRPGHFRGVETVVLKLLNIIQPDRAYFGQKDAQQLAIIRRMVADLNVPVEIVAVPTVREADGLALSSRNRRLTPAERSIATVLWRALQSVQAALTSGERSVTVLRSIADGDFNQHPGARLEYFDIVNPETLEPLTHVEGRALIAGAIWLGETRLIDNLLWPS